MTSHNFCGASRTLHTAIVFAAVLALHEPAVAMTAAWTPFSELVGLADVILDGRVIDVRQSMNARGNPSTEVTFEVFDVMKGVAGSTYRLDLLGGRVGDVELLVPGMPVFAPGDHAVLFVAQNGAAICPLVGATQGYFRVQFDLAMGEEVVEQYRSSGAHVQMPAGQNTLLAAPWSDGRTTLAEFKNLIASELANRARKP